MGKEVLFDYHELFNLRILREPSEYTNPPCSPNAISLYITNGLSGFLFFHDGKVFLKDDFVLITPSHFDCSIYYSPVSLNPSCIMLQINVDKILDVLSLFNYKEKDRTKIYRPKAGWFFYGGRVLLIKREEIESQIENLLKYVKENRSEDSNVVCEFEQLNALFNIFSIVGKTLDELNSALDLTGFKKKLFDKRIRGIVDYIENNYASDIDLKDLAERFKMSKTYLCQSFKRETNQTVINYLNSIRMIQALKMFQKGEGNVSRVAMENGFHDVSYFIQLFKKSTGFTPKQFYKKSKVE